MGGGLLAGRGRAGAEDRSLGLPHPRRRRGARLGRAAVSGTRAPNCGRITEFRGGASFNFAGNQIGVKIVKTSYWKV